MTRPFEVNDYLPGHPRFDYQVTLDEEVAHGREDLVDQLLADFAGAFGVVDVHHEDREVILVAAPLRTSEQLESWLADWFSRQEPDVYGDED